MAAIRMTFSLDAATSRSLREAAESSGKPRSEVVRAAILDHAERVGRLTEAARWRRLSGGDG